MAKFEGIAHVVWEVPFPLRLPPEAIAIWEPREGVALLDPRPGVGDLSWRRKSSLVAVESLFPDRGPENQIYPSYDYRLNATLRSGQQVMTTMITGGENGGFVEARQYAIVSVFLCLADLAQHRPAESLERSAAALNNILDIYRFVTLDPYARTMRADRDLYYAFVSIAQLPSSLGDIEPLAALQMVNRISFGARIGVDRTHQIGISTYDDLFAREPLPTETLRIFDELAAAPHQLEVFHHLIFSSIRRLKRYEYALSVLDAQSAFESVVATILVEQLKLAGKQSAEVDRLLSVGGSFHNLQSRLREVDRMAIALSTGSSAQQFLGSSEEGTWRTALYGLRNRIVHEGERNVTFDSAKAALVAGVAAIERLQNLTPTFNRQLMWTDASLHLSRLTETAGGLARVFA